MDNMCPGTGASPQLEGVLAGWVRLIVGVLVVSGCASDDGPGGSRPGETATDPTLAISDRIECAQPERRAEQVFVRHVIGEEWRSPGAEAAAGATAVGI